jgi:hypothetical protein
VREEFYKLTSDFFEALVLNQFNFYQLATRDIDEFIEQENARSRVHDIRDGYIDPCNGWFWKSAEQLCEELMRPFKRTKAQEVIQSLIDRGWVMVRENPAKKWDRIKQYRLDLVKIVRDLQDLNLQIPIWDPRTITDTRKCIAVERLSITATRQCITAERQAIPEVTSEGTTERPTPKPSSGAEEGFSSSSIFVPKSEGPGIGDSDKQIINPGEGNRWLVEARRDAKAWARLQTVFPRIPFPEQDSVLARQFVKARRDGILNDRDLDMLATYYRKARLMSEDEAPTWKVRDYHAFMKSGHLRKAVAYVRSYVQEELGVVRQQLRDAYCEITVQSNIMEVLRQTKLHPAELAKMADAGACYYLPLLFHVHSVKLQDPWVQRLKEEKHDDIVHYLAFNPAWIARFSAYEGQLEAIFGVTKGEALERAKEQRSESEAEAVQYCAFLGLSYEPVPIFPV